MAARANHEIEEGSPDHPTEETVPRTKAPSLTALAILKKESDPDIFLLRFEEICHRLYSGVLLFDKEKKIAEQKFWVDKELGKNCFLVLSEAIGITWSGNSNKYWEYVVEKEKCFEGEVDIPVAKLKSVCWLEATGRFRTILLSPKTTYKVSFVVKMSESSSGWHYPLSVNLNLPDGSTQGRTENLQDKPKGGDWFRILIGSFTTNPKNVGELTFALRETGNHWKSGLIIKGVLLQALD
ncbi:hypothetical protein MLD38_037518 [Melastoma candidum]|uniref:Uncharacterized protein n=1 Tax=Melastoma candidum TaxID=119954 RepID=A0ACB9LNI6_9MYRT|nr:hypothetical protein MLD38_037518 [Melastoma candidum]